MEKSSELDEISLAYGRNFRELEAARKRFDGQCDTLEQQLAEYARGCALGRGMSVVGVEGRLGDTGPWKNVWIARAFAAEVKSDKSSCVSIGLCRGSFWNDGSDLDFGFVPYLAFAIKKQLRDTMGIQAKLGEVCPLATEARGVGPWLYLPQGLIVPGMDTFSQEGMRSAIDRMVDSFAHTDEWLAKAYRQIYQMAGALPES
jgi:hypothetical protein